MPTGMLPLPEEVQIKLATNIFLTQIEMGLSGPAEALNPGVRTKLAVMLENLGRPGRATSKGFYDYSDSGNTI